MKRFLLVILSMISSGGMASSQTAKLAWPNGAKAAICLTYDDAIDIHLDIAIPDLNQAGMAGTFYLQGTNIRTERIPDWRSAAEKGHELGNHTAFHPCSQKLDFITPEFAAENYTIRRILSELQVMNTLLFAMDGQEQRTYAYTCGETMFGGESLIEPLRKSGLFVAARGTSGGVVTDFENMEPLNVNSWGQVGATGEDLIRFAEETKNAGGLGIYTFHGIGGDYLEVSRDAHQALLKYLSDNRDVYWVATFREVMLYIQSETGKQKKR